MSPDVVVERGLSARMRDGVRLAADVYRPNAPGRFPALVVRLPYGKAVASTVTAAHPVWFARHGYVVVVQDCRGRGASEGRFYPWRSEAADGYDTIEWVASLPFCDGNVGMYGFSYQAAVQLLAAARRPPHLKAIAPAMTSASFYDGWAYHGGCYALAFNLSWALQLALGEARYRGDGGRAQRLLQVQAKLDGALARLPTGDQAELADGELAPYYFDWLAHDTYDDYWRALDAGLDWAAIEVPSLHIGGWFDVFGDGPARAWEHLRRASAVSRWLVVGPWPHLPWSRVVAGRDFGEQADGRLVDDLHLRWFDRWLKGIRNGVDDEAPVRLFATGANVWQVRASLDGSDGCELFLSSGGRANSLGGDGSLVASPREDEPPDVYVYDPLSPTLTVGPHPLVPSIHLGPLDQRPAERSQSVLVYTSAPLHSELQVVGRPTLQVWVSSSTPDTDIVAKLIDLEPAGTAVLVSLAPLRLRFRDALSEPALLEPGRVYPITLRFPLLCHVFGPGHAVRLELASSCFPLFDRNPNTGGPAWRAGPLDLQVATVVVFHDRQRPSSLTLPLAR